jgi:hypothetical protein
LRCCLGWHRFPPPSVGSVLSGEDDPDRGWQYRREELANLAAEVISQPPEVIALMKKLLGY